MQLEHHFFAGTVFVYSTRLALQGTDKAIYYSPHGTAKWMKSDSRAGLVMVEPCQLRRKGAHGGGPV